MGLLAHKYAVTAEPSVVGRGRRRAVLVAAAAAFATLWCAALLRFIRTPPGLECTFPAREPHPPGPHNLAFYRYGTRVRASSYDNWADRQHHPGFLVDGLADEPPNAKWTTLPNDVQPFVELRWTVPARLQRVTIRHAGAREEASLTARRYELTCLLRDREVRALQVRANESAVATHGVVCDHALGIRLTVWPNQPGDVVRLYEVQAWGYLTSPS